MIQDSRRVASYSFIHSIATSLGMSIYEEVSQILVEDSYEECFRKYDLGSVLSEEQKSVIDNIIRKLRNGERPPDYEKDMGVILNASSKECKQQKGGSAKIIFGRCAREGTQKYNKACLSIYFSHLYLNPLYL